MYIILLNVKFSSDLLNQQLSNHRAVNELFSNWTWSIREPENFKQAEILASWAGPQDNIFLTLALFTVIRVGNCCTDEA